MRPGIIDTYLQALQKQAFYKAANLVYTPGYSLWDTINRPTPKETAPAPEPAPLVHAPGYSLQDIINKPTPKAPASAPVPAPAPHPAPAPVAQPQAPATPPAPQPAPAPVAPPVPAAPQSNITPPTPNVDIAIPGYNVGTALNLPEAIDLGGDIPEPLPNNSLGVPADAFKNAAPDTPEVRQALAEQAQIRKQYEANAPKVKSKRRAARNETQRIIDAEKARRAAGVARTDIIAGTGRYIGQQEAAGNVLPTPKVKPNPQVGSNVYSDPEAAYNMFVRRGVSPEHALAASDAIRTYNEQRNKGADHKTAMDIVNTSFAPGLPLGYQEQMIDHLNRQYRMNQNRQYINPQYTEAQAREDARRQAAMDNNRFLNPSDFTAKDRLRGASTYVSHGNQVVDPRTGQIDRKATARRQQASNRRRAEESAAAAGLKWSPTRGTYVYR